MPGAARLGDNCSGHQCWVPRPIIVASSTVNVNGRGAARLGDMLAIHTCPPPASSPHPGSIIKGCPTVLINGQPAARIGDSVNCGSSIMMGSSNVMIGDGSRGGASLTWSA